MAGDIIAKAELPPMATVSQCDGPSLARQRGNRWSALVRGRAADSSTTWPKKKPTRNTRLALALLSVAQLVEEFRESGTKAGFASPFPHLEPALGVMARRSFSILKILFASVIIFLATTVGLTPFKGNRPNSPGSQS